MKRIPSLLTLLVAFFPLFGFAAEKISVPSIGGTNNPVVRVVEFGDYQCPFCLRAHQQVIPKILAEYGDKVQIVFRNFPLEFHGQAKSAAFAAICAGEQGKLADMHNFLYDNQARLGDNLYREGAKQLGLNENAFEACLDSDLPRASLARDLAEADDMQISGTPGFILTSSQGVERINGAYPYETFKAAIERLLHPGQK